MVVYGGILEPPSSKTTIRCTGNLCRAWQKSYFEAFKLPENTVSSHQRAIRLTCSTTHRGSHLNIRIPSACLIIFRTQQAITILGLSDKLPLIVLSVGCAISQSVHKRIKTLKVLDEGLESIRVPKQSTPATSVTLFNKQPCLSVTDQTIAGNSNASRGVMRMGPSADWSDSESFICIPRNRSLVFSSIEIPTVTSTHV